jgi:hypothetical protein
MMHSNLFVQNSVSHVRHKGSFPPEGSSYQVSIITCFYQMFLTLNIKHVGISITPVAIMTVL